jgi:hypothetical protein
LSWKIDQKAAPLRFVHCETASSQILFLTYRHPNRSFTPLMKNHCLSPRNFAVSTRKDILSMAIELTKGLAAQTLPQRQLLSQEAEQ